MIGVNTDLAALSINNYARLNLAEFNRNTERLGSGNRVNRAGDDASGLAISQGMMAQIRGMRTAVQNVQDDINLLQAADAALDEIQTSVIRIRDLTLRLANRATMDSNPKSDGSFPPLPSVTRQMANEVTNLKQGLEQLGTLMDYNGKGAYSSGNPATPIGLVYGTYSTPGQVTQIGPDNSVNQRLSVVLPDVSRVLTVMGATGNALDPPPNASDSVWLDYATTILSAIDEQPTGGPAPYGLDSLSQARADIGVLMKRAMHAIEDLQAEDINLNATRSRITDANLAEVVTAHTKNMIVQQSSQAAATQANAEPLLTSQLLGAIFDGMTAGPFK